MTEEPKNPYNQTTEEALYLAYEHGYNSQSKDDCPYSEGTLEAEQYRPAWLKGFIDGKPNRPNKKAPQKPKLSSQEPKSDLEGLSTEELFKELRKRKRAEYEGLVKKKAEIEEKLNKLKYLFEKE